MKLNLGSGGRPLEGYVGVDLDPRADIVCDIRNLGFTGDNTVEEIIAIHVIEHFYKWEIQTMLQEWRRVLVPGGRIILECPNLKKVAQFYLMGAGDNMGMWGFYGNPDLKNEYHCHHWGYSPETLEYELRQAGFKNIEHFRAQFKMPERDMRIEAVK
jgi:predicted SAM-dependent methyltransferase